VWKKGHKYKTIFEIEYLNPKNPEQLMDKRKYAIGSLMLGYVAMLHKSIDTLYFVTNSEPLCGEIAKLIKLANLSTEERIFYESIPSIAYSTLKKVLTEDIK
jgi:hypothetical protein